MSGSLAASPMVDARFGARDGLRRRLASLHREDGLLTGSAVSRISGNRVIQLSLNLLDVRCTSAGGIGVITQSGEYDH